MKHKQARENGTKGYLYYIAFTVFSAVGSMFAKVIYDIYVPEVTGY